MSRAAAANATMWSAIDQVGRQAVTFVVSVILARLITPAEFGAVAIMMFFVIFVAALIHQSLGTAVIQRQRVTERYSLQVTAPHVAELSRSAVTVGS